MERSDLAGDRDVHPRTLPAGIVNPISPGSVTWTCPETVMPAGIIYPINPVMERSDLAGDRDVHPRTLPAGIVN
ncbi:MAG: hypothetical protein K2J66_01635, partial [Muribaculaceae bacterium]|nr:hypothetical protein [Muribaculaceae bacterium]